MTEENNLKKTNQLPKSELDTQEVNVVTVENQLGIKGITKVISSKQNTAIKVNRFETKSFEIDRYIYINYQGGTPFVTGEMSKYLREEKGWSTSAISGQLNAKKNSGLLESRKPNEEEAELIGKNISIWNTTKKFDEMLKAELVDFDKYQESLSSESTDEIK